MKNKNLIIGAVVILGIVLAFSLMSNDQEAEQSNVNGNTAVETNNNTEAQNEEIKSTKPEIENFAKAILERYGIEAKTIEFNIEENILYLKELSAKINIMDEGSLFIDEIAITNPNIKAFDAKTEGQPLVAEKIILKNIKASYTTRITHQINEQNVTVNLAQDIEFGSFIIDNWKQNLGKTFELGAKAYDEEFFKAILDSSIDNITYLDYKVATSSGIGNYSVKIMQEVKSTIMKNFAQGKIDSIIMEGLNSIQEDPMSETNLITKVEKFTWNNIQSPSPAFLATLSEIIPKFLSDTISQTEEKNYASQILNGFSIFANIDMTVENLKSISKTKNASNTIADFEKVEFKTEYDVEKSVKFALTVNGFKMDLSNEMVNESQFELFTKLYGDTLVIDAFVAMDLEANKQPSSFIFSFGVKDLAENTTKVEFIIPEDLISKIKDLPQLLVNTSPIDNSSKLIEDDLKRWISETLFISIENNYNDKKLLPIILVLTGNEFQHTLESTLETYLQNLSGYVSLLGENNSMEFKQCISNPGKLDLKITSKTPLNFESVILTFLVDPTSFEITTVCEEGQNIIDIANDLIK